MSMLSEAGSPFRVVPGFGSASECHVTAIWRPRARRRGLEVPPAGGYTYSCLTVPPPTGRSGATATRRASGGRSDEQTAERKPKPASRAAATLSSLLSCGAPWRSCFNFKSHFKCRIISLAHLSKCFFVTLRGRFRSNHLQTLARSIRDET